MIHYQRCRICGHEVEVELGPEAFSTAAYLLAEHIRSHTLNELSQWALLSHGVVETGTR